MSSKKILFLMNSMQGYAEQVIDGLKRRGFEVDWYENSSKIPKSDMTFLQRCIRSLAEDFKVKKFIKLFFEIEKKYYSDKIKKFNEKYDFIIDIGSKSSPNFIKILQEKIKAEKILFVWDDLNYDDRSKELISCFDKVYSYCPEDANRYNLIYRPSFYCDCFKNENTENKDLDIFYIGHMREKDRTRIVEKISKYTEEYKTYIKLVGKFKLRYLDRFLSYKVYKKFFIKKSFDIVKLSEYFKKSKIILDITIKSQVGLGLRPIEAIGAKCKLITTNKNIKNYDFYNENNIFILEKDFSNVSDLKNFVDTPFVEYSEEMRYKYSLDGFINEVLGE